jgi:probable phosphoglycerate mutase
MLATPELVSTDQTLWLVRHGESTWNTLGLAQGHCDQARLTLRGTRQAWAVVGRLCDRPIGALYASDLHRAMETAAPLASVLGLPVHRDSRLRERCLGAAEGTPIALLSPAVTGLGADRVADPDTSPPGGESLRDFYRRVAGFVDDLAPAGEIAVVAHGGTLRMLDACLNGVPVERMSWAPVMNGCVLRHERKSA